MTNKDRAYAVRTLLSVLGSAHCALIGKSVVERMTRNKHGPTRPVRWAPDVVRRIMTSMQRLGKAQWEPLCRALRLRIAQASSTDVINGLDREGSLKSLTQLAELDRRTVMAVFRELAGGEPFCIDTLREVSMEALRRYLKKVLLEVRVLLLCSFN